jgi:hypothetical protein
MADTNTNPVTDAEVDEFIAGLSDVDKEELRRQRLVAAAVSRQTPKTPNLGTLSHQEFETYKRSLGI